MARKKKNKEVVVDIDSITAETAPEIQEPTEKELIEAGYSFLKIKGDKKVFAKSGVRKYIDHP